MNSKIFSVFSFLAIVIVLPLMLSFVAAEDIQADYNEEWANQLGFPGKILRYIFGPPTTVVTNITAAFVITIALWLLIALTFGDIIATFSTFSPAISWTIGVLITIIAANLNWITKPLVWLTTGFVAFGAIAVYIGLGGAFVAFIAINLGIRKLGPWVMQRRAMKEGAKARAGGTELAGTVRGLKDVGRALKEE